MKLNSTPTPVPVPTTSRKCKDLDNTNLGATHLIFGLRIGPGSNQQAHAVQVTSRRGQDQRRVSILLPDQCLHDVSIYIMIASCTYNKRKQSIWIFSMHKRVNVRVMAIKSSNKRSACACITYIICTWYV